MYIIMNVSQIETQNQGALPISRSTFCNGNVIKESELKLRKQTNGYKFRSKY
jgi:hypothetical protein